MAESFKTELAKLGQHPFAQMLRAWLERGGLKPDQFEEKKESGFTWSGIVMGEGMSFFASLYYPQNGDLPFFYLETAISVIKPENVGEVCPWLLQKHHGLPSLFRLAVDNEGLIVLQARGPCEAYDPAYFSWILAEIGTLGDVVLKELIAGFGLKPFAESIKAKRRSG